MDVATIELNRDENWQKRIYSNGWTEASSVGEVREPGTGKVVASIGIAGVDKIATAAKSARGAQLEWADRPYEERSKILRIAADILERDPKDFVSWIVRESGSAVGKAHFEIAITIRALREASAMPSQPQGLVLPSSPGRISICRREPLGVVGVISPFNFPLYLAMRAVAPALAVGNAVVLKPDTRTAVCGGVLIAKLFEAAGLSPGVLHVLPGDAEAGKALCSDPNIAMIQFTGSTAAGRKVGEVAGRNLKKVSLELGGKNSLLILDDADLDLAVANAAWGAFLHQGQICMASGRILVHQKLAQEFTRRLASEANAVKTEASPTSGSHIGPIIDRRQLERVHGMVSAAISSGATLHAGGRQEGPFYRPTVLGDVRRDNPIFDEEVFGPVASVTTFSSDAEAIELANDTPYGLSAGIISSSAERAIQIGRQLRTGLLHINDQTVNDDVLNPFGGRGISGNGTSIGGPANWEEFTQWQWMTIKGTAGAYKL